MTPQRMTLDLGEGQSLSVMAVFNGAGELRDVWAIRAAMSREADALKEAAHTIDTLGGLLRSNLSLEHVEARARSHVDVLARLRAALRDPPPQPGR